MLVKGDRHHNISLNIRSWNVQQQIETDNAIVVLICMRHGAPADKLQVKGSHTSHRFLLSSDPSTTPSTTIQAVSVITIVACMVRNDTSTCCAAVSMEACIAAGDGLSPTLGTLSSTATWNRAAGTPLQTGPLTRRCNNRRLSPVAARTAC